MQTQWHLVIPGRVCYDGEDDRRNSLSIHQFDQPAKDEPKHCQLEDDMEWEEPEGMALYSRRLAPLQPVRTMNASLKCCGEKDTRFFSHACASLWFQDGFKGAGEMWKFSSTEEKAVFTISGCGGEENLYLVNDEGKPTLSRECETQWLVSQEYNGAISISVFSTDGYLVLSHANGELTLQSDYRGEGELWKLAGVGSQ